MADAKKILIVDDEPDMVEWLEVFFQDNGYDTIFAYDGFDGFEKAKSDFPPSVWEIVESASEFRSRFADVEPVSEPSFFSSFLPMPLFVRAREIQAYRTADQLAAFRSLEGTWPDWRKRAIDLAMSGWDLAAEGTH